MKTLGLIIATFAFGLSLLWGVVSYLQWDQSERSHSVVQILPFELSYRYQGNADSYKDGDAWYATLFTQSSDGKWKECSEDLLSFKEYEHLKTLSDATLAATPNYVVARVFQLKSTGEDRCEVNVSDWDTFLRMQQPDEASVVEFNTLKQEEVNQTQ